VLASASPRRRQLLTILNVPFAAIETDVDETPRPGEAPLALAERLAGAKAVAGARQCPGDVVLGADTVVAHDGEALGKPVDYDDAVRMLRRLRLGEHAVITAVAAARMQIPGDPDIWLRTSTCRVWMRPYPDAEIADYVASGDPFDKAGGYAVQHAGFHPVARMEGCFLTVVGLPLPEVREVLRNAGIEVPLVDPRALNDACPDCRDQASLYAP
jgi:septum formation protein